MNEACPALKCSLAEMLLKRAIAIDEALGLPVLDLHQATLVQLQDLRRATDQDEFV